MSFEQYAKHDGLGLAELVAKKEAHPSELVEIAIRRIEQVNPVVNAVVYRLYEQARDAAQGPLPDGPFRGVPYLLKDMVVHAGTEVSFGSQFPICNAAGLPAMSVPLHWNDAGLPIGVHFAARFGDEATLFRLAGQLERARPWANRFPAPLA